MGGNNLWKTPTNWMGNVAPIPMVDDLLFPAGARQTTNTNNFDPGTTFLRITFTGGGYALGGNPLTLGLSGVGGSISDSSGAVTNIIGLSMAFPGSSGSEAFNIAANTELMIAGQLSGASGYQIRKSGTGTVVFAGDDSGFSGPVTVSAGTLQIQNKTALGINNTTTVDKNAGLRIKDVSGTINETLVLSGGGALGNGGALENVHGFNTLAGTIKLLNSSIIGADAGQLNLTGPIQGVTTLLLTIGGNSGEDGGRVAFLGANSYAAITAINHGTLNIQNPQGLGPIGKTAAVNVGAEGALELQLPNAIISGMPLSLAGPGINNAGALRNVSGNNIWDGNITLQNNSSIGVDAASTLTIGNAKSLVVHGVISESNGGAALTKEGFGELILVRKNTYSGLTTVDQGILTAENNFALGGAGFVTPAGARVVGNATLQLAVDPTTGNSLTINEPLALNGPGFNRLGALYSVSGANTWQGVISLPTDASVGANRGSTLFLGDPSTGAGTVQGAGGLTKTGAGTVVLPNADSYFGSTFVTNGVLEVQDSQSLGVAPPGFAVESESSATVSSGAALWVAGQRPRDNQAGVTITQPLILAGTGINATGALFNVSGTDVLSGDIGLTGDTFIGVTLGSGAPGGSELSLTGDISDVTGNFGLKKVGTGRLILSGYNLYTGSTEVVQGILTVASSNALGTPTTPTPTGSKTGFGSFPGPSGGTTTSGVIVDNRAALELKGGIQVFNQPLSLSGSGIKNAGALDNVSDDNRWTGNITFTSNVIIGAAANSRLTLRGNIQDSNLGFSLTKAGAGEVVLGGVDTYSGGTLVQAGSLNIQSGSALGNSLAGTTVQDGAALQLQTGVNIGDQRLTVAGNGPATADTQALPGGGQWFPVGPTGITNGQSGGTGANKAVQSGRINGIATDPHDPNLIYIATGSGGVWRTKNGGLTWVPLTDNLSNVVTNTGVIVPTLFTNSIAIAPSDPNTLYVGTGNPDWNSNTFAQGDSNTQFYGRGVLKSTDGGATWTLLTGNAGLNEFDRQEIERIIVDPSDANTVYLATAEQAVNGLQNNQSGIWKSEDGGKSWTNMTAGTIPSTTQPPFSTMSAFTDLLFDPSTLVAPFDKTSRHIFAAVGTPAGDQANGLFESFDSGVTWKINPKFPAVTKDGVLRVTISPNPNTPVLYAALSSASGLLDSIQVSLDDGKTWNKVSKAPPEYFEGQAFFDSVIAEDPHNPNIVYLGGTNNSLGADLLETTDGGGTWTRIDLGADGGGPHNNQHAFTFDSLGRLLDGNDGGIWRLDVPTVAPVYQVHWSDLNSNLQITQFQGIAVNPQNPNLIYGGSQDNGFEKLSGVQPNGGLPWVQQVGDTSGQVGIDLNNPTTVYHTFFYADPHLGLGGTVPVDFFQRSDNGGQTFINVVKGIGLTDNANFYLPFVVDPVRTNRLVLGTDRIYESVTRGDVWTALSTPGQNGWSSTGPIDAVAVAPSDPNVIYAAVGSQMFVTLSHGQATPSGPGWTEVDIGAVGRIAQIYVDPLNPLIAYAVRSTFDTSTFAGRVFKTVTGGKKWQDISGDLPNLPVWSILVDSRPNSVVYVGTDAGVFETTDSGQGTFQWQKFGTGLPNVQVRQLVLDPIRNTLVVGTYGRGVWKLDLDPVQGNAGAIRAITGSNSWAGDITLLANNSGSIQPATIVGAEFGASLTLAGILSDTGTGTGLTKNGLGKVTLISPNAYGGPTVVNLGVLNVQNVQSLGTNPNVTVQNGGSLELQGDGMDFTEHLTLNGPGASLTLTTPPEGALLNVGGSNTWSGNLTLGSDASISANNGSQLTVAGIIDDNLQGVSQGFGVTKGGNGEVVFTSANTYSGDTTVDAGDLNVQNIQALGTAAQGTAFVMNGGALWLQFPVPTVASPLPLGKKVTPDNVMTTEALHLNGTGLFGLGALRSVSGNNAWPGPVVLDNAATIGVDDDGSGLTVDGGSPLTLGGVITDGSNVQAALTKTGLGTLVLTNQNLYSGGTEVAEGVLNIQNAQALGSTASGFDTQVDDQAALELQFTDPQPGQPTTVAGEMLSLTGSGINGGGALRDVSGDAVWSGPITLAGSSTVGVENDPNNSTPTALTLMLTGDISGQPTNDFTKTGPGTLVLPSANDYAGQTLVTQGIVQISDSNALGAGGGVTVSTGATLQLVAGSGGPLTVNGQTLQLAGTGVGGLGALENVSGNNTWTGLIVLNGATTFNVAGANDALITNSITEAAGGSGLTKTGPGTLVLAIGNTDTYTGVTTVQAGTLVVDAVVSGAAVVNGGTLIGSGQVLGAITVNSGGTLSPGDQGSGPGTLTVGTAATPANVTLSSGSAYNVQFFGPNTASSLQVNGNLNLGGATLDTSFFSASLLVGDTFTIIQTTGTLTGTFAGIGNNGTISKNGMTFQVMYTGNSVMLKRIA
jgi:autotransporter-associated beta strand protein